MVRADVDNFLKFLYRVAMFSLLLIISRKLVMRFGIFPCRPDLGEKLSKTGLKVVVADGGTAGEMAAEPPDKKD
jgi:hypothetical protein